MTKKHELLVISRLIKRLKEIRLEKGLSHDALARKVGVSRPAISHLECGKRKPTLLMALKLAHGLEIPLSEVLGEAEKS
jgi:transcriptional regulator with XRE-family HTH domain